MNAAAAGRTLPFVTSLRSRPGIVTVGGPGGERIAVRVEFPDQWDTVAFDVRTDTPVTELKRAALAAFAPRYATPEDYVLKLRGFEVIGEAASVANSGARDGSTYLMSYRRRRPVR
jgi:hypothetical protein